MSTLTTGHLFAGIDGLGLGLASRGFQPLWFSESGAPQSILLRERYEPLPNHGDITQIDWADVAPVDVLTGGFPCQDISQAGKKLGIMEGTRSGLWIEYVRAIRELRPRIVIVENVSALLVRGIDIVLGDLSESGFDARWSTLRGADLGAPHERDRLFIVAVATDSDDAGWRERRRAWSDAQEQSPPERHRKVVAHNRGVDWEDFEVAIRLWEVTLGRTAPDITENGKLSVRFAEWFMGFPDGWVSDLVDAQLIKRTDALRMLGNAVIPQCAEVVGDWAVDLATT